MAAPCVFVPPRLMAGEETRVQAVAETITIALEHLTGAELKCSTFTFYTNVTYYGFWIMHTKETLVFFFI